MMSGALPRDESLCCPQCGYSLAGLPDDHHCPECGFGFQKRAVANLVSSHAIECRWTREQMLLLSLAAIFLAVSPAIGAAIIFHRPRLYLVRSLCALVLFAVYWYRMWRYPEDESLEWKSRSAWVAWWVLLVLGATAPKLFAYAALLLIGLAVVADCSYRPRFPRLDASLDQRELRSLRILRIGAYFAAIAAMCILAFVL